MLKPTDDPRLLFCDRCKKHIVIDRTHPLFLCEDGKHYCAGKDNKQQIEIFELPLAVNAQ
jgi:hypothetical protein